MITTGPRALKDPKEPRERVAAVHSEPRVQPLNAWVAALQDELGDAHAVPRFDPASGGVEAGVLFLLEAPGQKSVGEKAALNKVGSGIISADNDDVTAKNC
ncbi:MAG: hypothetical protein ABS81_13745 [Pseudonocardia sp. SCN 72-86]|nr:MAG: hypothetical protein ABS81_13745 [Pseudonocardia sp. SCN 72-86]